MSKVVIKNQHGSYYIEGSGFVGNLKTASRVCSDSAQDILGCASKFGISATVEVAPALSWAVYYIRSGDVVDGKLSKVAPVAGLNQIDPSKRRFATKDEAIQHGSRFDTRRKERNDPPGTAGHKGFYVEETTDPVNSAVNWKSGLTNSI